MPSEKLQNLLDTYEPLSDAQERMALVVDDGNRSGLRLPEAQRVDALRIRGCMSAAWVQVDLVEGKCHFACAADSPLVQGLLSCLCQFYTGMTPAEVAASEEDPLAALQLLRNLSPTRQNGLSQARARIRALAAALAA